MVRPMITGICRSDDLGAEKQVAFEIGGIGNDQDHIGPVFPFGVEQHIVGHEFIRTFRIKAVGTGQVDDGCVQLCE